MNKLGNYATAAEMPIVLSLPSGLKLSTVGLLAWPIGESITDDEGEVVDKCGEGQCFVAWVGTEDNMLLDDPRDAAAVHAALSRFGYEADSPTLKGDDKDGDGRTGE